MWWTLKSCSETDLRMSSSCDNFYIYQQRTSNDDLVSEDIEIKRKDQEFRSQKEVMNMMLETWKADSQARNSSSWVIKKRSTEFKQRSEQCRCMTSTDSQNTTRNISQNMIMILKSLSFLESRRIYQMKWTFEDCRNWRLLVQ